MKSVLSPPSLRRVEPAPRSSGAARARGPTRISKPAARSALWTSPGKDAAVSSWWTQPELQDEEDELPEHGFGDDERTMPESWWEESPADQRAAWEIAAPLHACKSCDLDEILDPLGHCNHCRYESGFCMWCGLDPMVYRRARACRTCYRWLNRNADAIDMGIARERLFTNAARRYAKRRKQDEKRK